MAAVLIVGMNRFTSSSDNATDLLGLQVRSASPPVSSVYRLTHHCNCNYRIVPYHGQKLEILQPIAEESNGPSAQTLTVQSHVHVLSYTFKQL